jgi:Lar family restriction alleviation protein
MLPDLKPCPFCGRKILDYTYGTKDREGTPVHVACVYCGACGPWRYVELKQDGWEKAVENEWNARAISE